MDQDLAVNLLTLAACLVSMSLSARAMDDPEAWDRWGKQIKTTVWWVVGRWRVWRKRNHPHTLFMKRMEVRRVELIKRREERAIANARLAHEWEEWWKWEMTGEHYHSPVSFTDFAKARWEAKYAACVEEVLSRSANPPVFGSLYNADGRMREPYATTEKELARCLSQHRRIA